MVVGTWSTRPEMSEQQRFRMEPGQHPRATADALHLGSWDGAGQRPGTAPRGDEPWLTGDGCGQQAWMTGMATPAPACCPGDPSHPTDKVPAPPRAAPRSRCCVPGPILKLCCWCRAHRGPSHLHGVHWGPGSLKGAHRGSSHLHGVHGDPATCMGSSGDLGLCRGLTWDPAT